MKKPQIPLFLACFVSISAWAQLDTSTVVASFENNQLRVPAVRVGDSTLSVVFSITENDEPELTLTAVSDRAAPLASTQLATVNGEELSIPCLEFSGSYYSVSAVLKQQDPTVVFDQVLAESVPACDTDLPGQVTFMSPHSNPIALNLDRVYSVNTPSGTVDVIDTTSNTIVERITVGIDPVAIAVRPDGQEIWVSNHISDSVSVIDTNPDSTTYHQVVATIQDMNPVTKTTLFDEPVGIAFAGNDKAYVALSSLDKIAIVDANAYKVTGHLSIAAQDPRAISVQGDRLYVTAFESNNKTELSGCFGTIDGDQCTFSLQEHVVNNNNVLSLGYDADIVKDPRVPDRDLFVYDTTTDVLLDTVSGVGTLLYGLSIDSSGKVYVAQTDARNEVNGKAGTQKHTLIEMENRAFLNQIAVVDCENSCSSPSPIELEPLPPSHPSPGMALATPFAIQISPDDSTLVLTAAGSNKLFTVDAHSGSVLGRLTVDEVPRGIALQSNEQGTLTYAWVLNVVANSVSRVNLSDLNNPVLEETILLEDPTPAELKLGRAMFNNAEASSTGTFSCESCHPDGHTDQLLWVLGGPQCEIVGCTQIPVRSTMPIRGLRGTAPFHWDGVPGDPFGGRNGANPNGGFLATCDENIPESCTRELVDGSLSSTMCDPLNCPLNEEGKPGNLTAEERDALAQFLLSIPHPPSRERAYDDGLTDLAVEGFDDFFIKDAPPGSVAGQTCGSVGCHAMPFWAGTNVPGNGMEAPSFRGLQDRWLVLPQGRINMWELINPILGNKGFDEFTIWMQLISGSTAAEWQMFLEASMGYPGAFARQITLNSSAVESSELANTVAMLEALELASEEETILLQGEGLDLQGASPTVLALQFQGGLYQQRNGDEAYSREQLVDLASSGDIVVTLTGRLPKNVSFENPQPAIWSTQNQFIVTKHAFPRLRNNDAMRLKGRYIVGDSSIFVNGRKVNGTISCESGNLPECEDEIILVQLESLPEELGMYFLQVQSPNGLLSNEYIFHVI